MTVTRNTPLGMAGVEEGGQLVLRIRSYNVLMREGRQTVGAVLDLTEDELINMRNMGRQGTDEVLAWQKKAEAVLDPPPPMTDTTAVRQWLTTKKEI